MSNFVRRVERINCGVHSAQRSDCVKGNSILRNVGTKDSEHFAFLKTTRGKAGSNFADSYGQLAVGDDASGWAFDEGWLVCALRSALHNEVSQRYFRDGDIGKGATKDHY